MNQRLILIACILGSTIVFLDGSVVNVALPSIEDDLGGGLVLQQWVVDAYLLTLGSLILVGGSLGDIFGAKKVFMIGVAGFGVTSLLCAVAPTGNFLIVGRGLQGIAGALLTPAALATITAVFSGEERGAAIGTWTAWTGIAFVIGPLVGGWLISLGSWRAIFLINIPLVLATLALVNVGMVPMHREGRRPRVDYLGAVLCMLGLGGPVFALIEQERRGWADPLILISLIGGLALLGLFIWHEARAREPMLPLRLFALRNFSWANIETFFVYAALATQGFFLVLFLQQLAGYSPLEAGLASTPVAVVMFLLSGRVGRLSMRFGPRWFMGVGPLVSAVGVLLISRLAPDFTYGIDLLLPMLVFALGLSLIVAPLTATVLADAGPSDAGIASGVNNAIARVAALIGIAALGAVVATSSSGNLTVSGFRESMVITACLLAVGGVAGIVGIRNRARVAEAA